MINLQTMAWNIILATVIILCVLLIIIVVFAVVKTLKDAWRD